MDPLGVCLERREPPLVAAVVAANIVVDPVQFAVREVLEQTVRIAVLVASGSAVQQAATTVRRVGTRSVDPLGVCLERVEGPLVAAVVPSDLVVDPVQFAVREVPEQAVRIAVLVVGVRPNHAIDIERHLLHCASVHAGLQPMPLAARVLPVVPAFVQS